MSFVDMTADRVWTDKEIMWQVQAILRSTVSAEDELKAARLFRLNFKSTNEAAFIQRVDSAIAAAIEEGHQAHIDNQIVIDRLAAEALLSPEKTTEEVSSEEANSTDDTTLTV